MKTRGDPFTSALRCWSYFSVPVLGFTLHAYLVHESTQALTIGAAVLAGIYAVLTFWIKNSSPAFGPCKSFHSRGCFLP